MCEILWSTKLLKVGAAVLSVLLAGPLVAQIQLDLDSLNEEVFGKEHTDIIVNSQLLLAGERLQYKAFNLHDNETTSALSKIIYVSLRNGQDSIIFNHKLKLANGTAHGFFFLPPTIKTGVYQVISYTNFSLNNRDKAWAQTDIYIINPFIKYTHASTQSKNGRMVKLSATESKYSDLTRPLLPDQTVISTSQSTYQKREKVTLTMESRSLQMDAGNYVLSVRRVDPLEISESGEVQGTAGLLQAHTPYIPEVRGEILSGQVLSVVNDRPAIEQMLAFSIPGDPYIFKLAKTDSTGRFFISIDEPYETAKAIVQVIGHDRMGYRVVMDHKIFRNDKSTETILQLDPGIKTWLEERSIQLQIENAYFDENKILRTGENPASIFHGNIGRAFVLDDYTRFPSLKETFVEVIPLARIRKRDGKEVFEVFDPYNPYKTGPFSALDPLLLLDGIFIQEAETIISLSANEIESIRVVPEPYRYGPKIFRGIIEMKTKNGHFSPTLEGNYIKELHLEKTLCNRTYAAPDYTDAGMNRIPDYRVQLLWKPDINWVGSSHMEHFYASDIPGIYEILIQGYTVDGTRIRASQNFKVE